MVVAIVPEMLKGRDQVMMARRSYQIIMVNSHARRSHW